VANTSRAELLLLLDGLDEIVEVDARTSCAKEINAFAATYPVPLVVSSRRSEYQTLLVQLRLGTAVELLPLEPDAVLMQLRSGGPRMHGVLSVIDHDEQLREFLRSPLLVSILTLAYGDRASKAIALGGAHSRGSKLIEDYCARRFELERQGSSTGSSPPAC
jgi:hypothetical protein